MNKLAYFGICISLLVGGFSTTVWALSMQSEGWQTVFSQSMTYSPDIRITAAPIGPVGNDLYMRMELTFEDQEFSFTSYPVHYRTSVNIHDGLQVSLPILDLPRRYEMREGELVEIGNYDWLEGETVLVEVFMRHEGYRPRDENGSPIWAEPVTEVIYLEPIREEESK